MHPRDLQDERERRDRLARRRVARDLRQALLQATPDECEALIDLANASQARAVTPDEASRKVAQLRDDQRERTALRQAAHQASLHATGDEQLAIERVMDAARTGHIEFQDALDCLGALRRSQQARGEMLDAA